jgi:hypothetical protein
MTLEAIPLPYKQTSVLGVTLVLLMLMMFCGGKGFLECKTTWTLHNNFFSWAFFGVN